MPSKIPHCSDCEYYACGFGRIPYRICKKAFKPIDKIGGYKTSPKWCPQRKGDNNGVD